MLSDIDQAEHDKAQAARHIIEDPVVVEALATMQRDIIDLWTGQAGVSLDVERREELYRTQTTLNRFVGLFDLYLQNGAQARHALNLPAEEKTFMQRIKEFF